MEAIILVLELIGTVAFAISGAMAAINKHLDIFGVLFCSITTALGGGTVRDILLGKIPPSMFTQYIYLIFALGTATVTFIVARQLKVKFQRNTKSIDNVNNIFDAVGLGVFTVVGINMAMNEGFEHNAFFVIFLGMTTGCGGGILRDVLINEVPFVFTKRIYAVASLAGGTVYYLLYAVCAVGEMLSVIVGIAVIFALRILASEFRWDLPKAY